MRSNYWPMSINNNILFVYLFNQTTYTFRITGSCYIQRPTTNTTFLYRTHRRNQIHCSTSKWMDCCYRSNFRRFWQRTGSCPHLGFKDFGDAKCIGFWCAQYVHWVYGFLCGKFIYVKFFETFFFPRFIEISKTGTFLKSIQVIESQLYLIFIVYEIIKWLTRWKWIYILFIHVTHFKYFSNCLFCLGHFVYLFCLDKINKWLGRWE